MAYVSFRLLNLTEGVTGGLIQNVDDAISSLLSSLGISGGGALFLELLGGMAIGAILIFLFPIHWCIYYRPDDVMLLIAVTVPWILCCAITSGLFARTPRKALHTSLAIGIGYAIGLSVIYILLAFIPGGFGTAIIDGLLLGLTDLPYLVAVLTAVFEGCLVGAVFGAFVGSLRYKAAGAPKKKKKKKVKVGKEEPETTEMFPRETVGEKTVSTPTSNICSNCGAKFTTDDLFCTNCGAKK
jgi:hypothetical protein